METSSSVYKPLRVVDQQIRLLKLQRGKAADDLVGELEIVHLRDHPSFTALSYVWGDPTNQVPMTLNWRKHHITESLAIALRKVRAEDVDQRLWIDAICINQFDMREKSYQVQLMGEIYTQATDTCIWLGEEADDSNMAMDIIGSLNAGGVEENPITVDGLQAISKLQERPWWTRVWVIQEALLSKKPTVRCGNKVVPLEAFVRLDDLRRGWNRTLKEEFPQGNRLIRSNPFSDILTDWDDRPTPPTGFSSLASWTMSTELFEATDPRDKIFALLGVSKAHDRASITPDYEQSVRHVYTQATVYFITRLKILLILRFDHDNKSNAFNLPSWVPDYTLQPPTPDPDWTRPGFVPFMFDYDCVGDNALRLHAVHPNTGWPNSMYELQVRSLHVDTIVFAGPNPHVPIYLGFDESERLETIERRVSQLRNNVKAWEVEIEEHTSCPYLPAQSKAEAFWRTLMGNRTQDGERLPDGPQNHQFEVWMDRSKVPTGFREGDTDLSDGERVRLYARPFVTAAVRCSAGRNFIITRNGYMGLAPMKSKPGDSVFILEGVKVPFVLRKSEPLVNEEPVGKLLDGTWSVVGESYLHGIMEGQFTSQSKIDDIRMVRLV